MYYFLKEDFEALNAEINKLIDKIREIGKEMGESCREGAETFHDNFAYEEGERQQYMWSGRIRELIRIRNRARVVLKPNKGDRVSLGAIVTVEDEEAGETLTFKIGSYMVLAEQKGGQKVISYNAPLARMLIGKKAGEIGETTIAGKRKSFRILKIE